MKTRWLVLLVAVGLLCGTDLISAAEEGSEWSWTRSVDFRSQYVGGMTGTRIVNEPVVQPSLTVSRGNCYANAWASFHTTNPLRLRKGDELDLSGGCTWSLGVVKHNLSILYYDIYPMKTLRGDLFALRDTLTFPQVVGWTPSLAIELDIPQDKQRLPGGLLYKVEISRDIFIGGDRVIGSMAFGGHDGAYGLKPETVSFTRGIIAYPTRIGSVNVSPSLMFQWGGKKGGVADDAVLLGINISW